MAERVVHFDEALERVVYDDLMVPDRWWETGAEEGGRRAKGTT
jgi:hypothetical protein